MTQVDADFTERLAFRVGLGTAAAIAVAGLVFIANIATELFLIFYWSSGAAIVMGSIGGFRVARFYVREFKALHYWQGAYAGLVAVLFSHLTFSATIGLEAWLLPHPKLLGNTVGIADIYVLFITALFLGAVFFSLFTVPTVLIAALGVIAVSRLLVSRYRPDWMKAGGQMLSPVRAGRPEKASTSPPP